jgi:hypothetical protein
LLWVAIGIALVILLAKVLVAGKDTMARFRTSPTTQEPRHSGSSGT